LKVKVTNLDALRNALSFSDMAYTAKRMGILECTLIEARDNVLTLTFSDLRFWLQTEIPAEVIEGGSVAVSTTLLEGFVRHAENPVTITALGDKVVVASGEAELKLAAYDDEDFPREVEARTICTITVQADVLRQALKKILFIPLKDELKPAKSSVYMHVVDRELRLVATDGVRIGIVPLLKQCDVENADVLFPRQAMQILQKLINIVPACDVTIAFMATTFTISRTVFMVGSFSLSSPVLDYEYPNYQRLIPDRIVSEVRVDRELIVKALRTLCRANRVVKLNPGHDSLTLSLVARDGSDIANTRRVKHCEIQGEIPQIAFDARLLLEPLGVIDDEEVTIRFSGPSLPAVVEGKDYTYIVMPMRLPTDKKN